MGWKRLPSKHLVQRQTRLLRAVPSQVLKALRDGDGTWAACPCPQPISKGKAPPYIRLNISFQLCPLLPIHSPCRARFHPLLRYLCINVLWEHIILALSMCKHTHTCTCTTTQHTAKHTLEDFIYKFMARNIVLSNSASLKPNTGTVCATERRKTGGFPQRFLLKLCAKYVKKYDLLWGKKWPCIKRKITVRYLLKKDIYILSNGTKLLKN